jgi:16S rRNA (adenine1518-N6/adenine1519-N6)-dimethyltransferase
MSGQDSAIPGAGRWRRKNGRRGARRGALPAAAGVRAPRPRKRFAQHFLTQPGIARRIVALAELTADDTVLEIGPGRGALTGFLAEAAGRVVLIEIDRDLAAQMRERFADRPQVEVWEGDVLRMDLRARLAQSATLTAVANLPYNVSTPVLMRLLESSDLFRRLVLMLQREVADRLCAESGSKTYGALSVMAQLAAEVRVAFRVPPTAFSPRPMVDSAVVVLDPRRPVPLTPAERSSVRRVVRAAFSQRRKQLGNGLSPLTPRAHELLTAIGIDPRRRPETLEPGDFVRLARIIATAAGGGVASEV